MKNEKGLELVEVEKLKVLTLNIGKTLSAFILLKSNSALCVGAN